MESSLNTQFIDVALRCWLAMPSEQNSSVCAMERGWPNPGSAGADGNSSPDNQSAAVNTYFPVLADLRNPEVHKIAKEVDRLGRLAFAHGSGIKQRRSFIMRWFAIYHPNKKNSNPDVATEVGAYLSR